MKIIDTMIATIGIGWTTCLICVGAVALFVYGIALTFGGYKRRVFFRILPGLFVGLLISFATGLLILMDGTRGDVIRFLMDATHGGILDIVAELIKAAITDSKAFGQGLHIASGILNAVGATGITDILDTVKTMVIVGVLFSVVCAVVSSAREKIGVALEFFAYGYALAAVSCLGAEQSSLLSAVLAIVVGTLLGALGYRISRIWIIITTSLVGGWIALYSFAFLSSVVVVIARNVPPGAPGYYYMWMIFIENLLGALMAGAAWAIAVGSLQRARDHQISRTRIIIAIGLYCIPSVIHTIMRAFLQVDGGRGIVAILTSYLWGIFPIIALIICGIYVQLKTTAASTEKTAAQPASAPADPVLRVLGHQISHMQIIIVAGICVVLTCVPTSSIEGIPAEWIEMILRTILRMIFFTIVSIYAQRRAMAVPADKTTAQPVAVTADSAAPLKRGAPSPAWPKIARAAKGASTSNGRSFCAKCGEPLEPGVKFCGKCGQPTRSGDDAAKSE